VLQSDMATTKGELDHLKESIDAKISNSQTNLESNFTRTNSALESKIDSKFGTLEKDIKRIVVELGADMGEREVQLAWRMFAAVI
jgi:hypothetical protein